METWIAILLPVLTGFVGIITLVVKHKLTVMENRMMKSDENCARELKEVREELKEREEDCQKLAKLCKELSDKF